MRAAAGNSRRFRWAGLAALCLMCSACASLPEVRPLDAGSASASKQPTISNAQGILSTRKASALMAKRWSAAGVDIKLMAAQEEALTGSPLVAGNKVTLLFDGPQTMAAMTAAIGAAKDNINLETYIFTQDEVGDKFADLLIEKQRAGVKVNVMYDSVGTLATPQAFFDKMKAAGIRMLAFNPVNPLKAERGWELNQRDHRKILIVDGKVAFTGGVNIDSSYSSGSLFRSSGKNDDNHKLGWRDTHVQIEGPAVAIFQWVFLQGWAAQQIDDAPEGQFFPPLPESGDKLVRVLASQPGSDFDIFKAYLQAIREAKKTIHITSAYFVPDGQTLRALTDAAKRGVDVQIILPGVTDSGLVFSAARSFYTEMLASGIKLQQMNATVLHAKTAVIDGVWSTIGSANIDTRSFLHNSELNVIVFSAEFGAAMENAFAEDLRDSTQITAQAWAKRPMTDRLKEWAARMMGYWL